MLAKKLDLVLHAMIRALAVYDVIMLLYPSALRNCMKHLFVPYAANYMCTLVGTSKHQHPSIYLVACKSSIIQYNHVSVYSSNHMI